MEKVVNEEAKRKAKRPNETVGNGLVRKMLRGLVRQLHG